MADDTTQSTSNISHIIMILLINIISTWFLIGVIWFVQIVHYPLFNKVGIEHFRLYEIHHTRLTTLVVGPPMLVEMISAIWLVLEPPLYVEQWEIWGALSLLLLVWVSTVFLQVPQHKVLTLGFHQKVYERLVTSNWLRTCAWTCRGMFLLWIFFETMHVTE